MENLSVSSEAQAETKSEPVSVSEKAVGNFLNPEVNLTEEKDYQGLIDYRSNQSRSDRLVEFITGLKFSDPALSERLRADQKNIRGKYGLPDRKMRFDSPSEYERKLREMAALNSVLN
ncbi:MAG: hypothetical protein WCW56_03320 [Candidatus Paceibacterota bacterium]|jgi:hypothetical protein